MRLLSDDEYSASRAEAADRELAAERASSLQGQFIMDCHTHFLRDDTRIMTFVLQRQAVGKAGWNPALAGTYGLKPLGPADGPVKSAIFGENNARLYKYEKRTALATDRIAAMKREYEKDGAARSNLRYGYVVPSRGCPSRG